MWMVRNYHDNVKPWRPEGRVCWTKTSPFPISAGEGESWLPDHRPQGRVSLSPRPPRPRLSPRSGSARNSFPGPGWVPATHRPAAETVGGWAGASSNQISETPLIWICEVEWERKSEVHSWDDNGKDHIENYTDKSVWQQRVNTSLQASLDSDITKIEWLWEAGRWSGPAVRAGIKKFGIRQQFH